VTDAEHAELDRFQAFIDLLGVSELDDAEFDRYMALCEKQRATTINIGGEVL
jgi:hypothetical protein